MEKIKKVILEKDYRSIIIFIIAGTNGTTDGGNSWQFESLIGQSKLFTEKEIIECKTGLFKIEYEPEERTLREAIDEIRDYKICRANDFDILKPFFRKAFDEGYKGKNFESFFNELIKEQSREAIDGWNLPDPF